MNLPVKISVKQVKKEALFQAYSKAEVLTYCQRCNNYGKNYSCPNFHFDTIEYLKPYEYAMVILTRIDTRPIQRIVDQLDYDKFESRVLSNCLIEEPDQKIDLTSVVSMYAFEDIKRQMENQLLELENQIDHSISLPPGSCTRCMTCTKLLGEPCRFPKMLRYSLEALGFLVTDLYKQCFDLELDWVEDALPESFCSCSVLMTKERASEALIGKKLAGMELIIPET